MAGAIRRGGRQSRSNQVSDESLPKTFLRFVVSLSKPGQPPDGRLAGVVRCDWVWGEAIAKWLFVFNSNFFCIDEAHRSATPSCQRFDHPPPVFRRSTLEGSNFKAELSALKKECEVQSGAGSL